LRRSCGDGEGADERDFGAGALGGEVKAPDGADVVAPPLEARGLGHAEAVEIQDATAEAVLCHLGDSGDFLISHRLELLREGAGGGRAVAIAGRPAPGCARGWRGR